MIDEIDVGFYLYVIGILVKELCSVVDDLNL